MPTNAPIVRLCVGRPKAHHMPQMFEYMLAAYQRSLTAEGAKVARQLTQGYDVTPLGVRQALRDQTSYQLEPVCQDQPQSLIESYWRQVSRKNFGDCEDYVVAISAILKLLGHKPGLWAFIGHDKDPWMHVVNAFPGQLVDATVADGGPWFVPPGLAITTVIDPTEEKIIRDPTRSFTQKTINQTGTGALPMARPTNSTNPLLDMTPRTAASYLPCPKSPTSYGMAASSVEARGVGVAPLAVVAWVIGALIAGGAGVAAYYEYTDGERLDAAIEAQAKEVAAEAARIAASGDDGSMPLPASAYESTYLKPDLGPPFFSKSSLFPKALAAWQATPKDAELPDGKSYAPGADALFYQAMLGEIETQHAYAEQALSWLKAGAEEENPWNLNPRLSTLRLDRILKAWQRLSEMCATAIYLANPRFDLLKAMVPALLTDVVDSKEPTEKKIEALKAMLNGYIVEVHIIGAIAGTVATIERSYPGIQQDIERLGQNNARIYANALATAEDLKQKYEAAKPTLGAATAAWIKELMDSLGDAAKTGLGMAGVVIGLGIAYVVAKKS